MCPPTPRKASSTTGPVSGKTGKASMRRSTSHRRRRRVRPGLELSQACALEFGEDLRREGRGSGATDTPEHLPGTLTLLRLPAVEGVDEHVGVHHISGGHPLIGPHTRSSYSSFRSNTYPLWNRWDSASRSASSRKPSSASTAPALASPRPPSPSSSKPSSIRRTNSASETPSSLALAFSARSCSSLMYNCFLTIYTSQGTIATSVSTASKPPLPARSTQRSSRSRSLS